jgi:uncharacterized membrane protein
MIYETPIRSLVKTVIYRVWVLCTTYIMLLVTGQTLESALVPTLIINAIWMTSFYVYDRIWARITWGRCQVLQQKNCAVFFIYTDPFGTILN